MTEAMRVFNNMVDSHKTSTENLISMYRQYLKQYLELFDIELTPIESYDEVMVQCMGEYGIRISYFNTVINIYRAGNTRGDVSIECVINGQLPFSLKPDHMLSPKHFTHIPLGEYWKEYSYLVKASKRWWVQSREIYPMASLMQEGNNEKFII